MSEQITNSSGNVFKDLGFDTQEAENLRIRSELMLAIKQIVKKKGWTQAEAAKKFDVSQPRISEIFQGKVDLFTVDKLISMLALIGQHVSISITEHAA